MNVYQLARTTGHRQHWWQVTGGGYPGGLEGRVEHGIEHGCERVWLECCILRSSLASTSAGSLVSSAYARSALRILPMITAAGRPEPATSPTTMLSSPDGRKKTSYQSPPTTPWPAMNLAAISTPATSGSADGSRLRCSAAAARPSVLACIADTAAAARSAASWSSVTSSCANRLPVSDPTCMTPTRRPPTIMGAPISVLIPLSLRIGFTTVDS